MVVIVVIMVIVVIKKNYIWGAWSSELLGRPNIIGLPGYGGYGGYFGNLDFQEKIIYAGLGYKSLGTPDLLKHPGYGGYRVYHGYRGYHEKLFCTLVMVVIMVMVVNKKNYICGACSFVLLGTSNLMGLPGYGGYGGYLVFQEKIIYAGLGYKGQWARPTFWSILVMVVTVIIMHGYQEKLFWRSMVIWVIGYT